jgi:hypothetical protein
MLRNKLWRNNYSNVGADLSAKGEIVASTKFIKTTGRIEKFYKKAVQQVIDIFEKLNPA